MYLINYYSFVVEIQKYENRGFSYKILLWLLYLSPGPLVSAAYRGATSNFSIRTITFGFYAWNRHNYSYLRLKLAIFSCQISR